jgi:hypothetical protein
MYMSIINKKLRTKRQMVNMSSCVFFWHQCISVFYEKKREEAGRRHDGRGTRTGD